ncbi:MAG: ATP-dependent helicase HrpB, partial [Pseudomonadota bacterium]
MPDTPAPPPAFGLPIDAALPALLAALARGNAVLAAPPGAGKTTAVPLALLDAPWAAGGRILMLEPRRLAARAAAERMAETLSEPVGATVGYRIRGEAKVGRTTRIEVVTEGILTRRLQSEPDLPGIACVIFDEIHERSIHADLGLALCLEVQDALRPELRLLAMSATLDTEAVARVLPGAEVIESAGRMYPVETRWLERPWSRPGEAPRGGARFEGAAATLIKQALTETEGDVLAFLPGRAEIEHVAARLTPATEAAVLPLHASLPFAAQRKALTKTDRRRVVLATAIAETSLTVAGVRVVVDGGRARRARVNPATGMARLVTVPVSRAEADQRSGRAGRTAPGVCYRLWTRHEEGALPAFAPPEILEADLAALALDLAVWGTQDAGTLAFIDPPPPGALKEARALLHALGALDGEGRITAHGRAMDARPSHPRLAHMLLAAEANGLGGEGALLAALLGERDPWRGPRQADLGLRLRALAGGATPDLDYPTAERIRTEARRLSPAKAKPTRAAAEAGRLLAHAYPDRSGLRRPGEAPRYLLSGGRGAVFSAEDPLAATRLIVAADLDDKGREAT